MNAVVSPALMIYSGGAAPSLPGTQCTEHRLLLMEAGNAPLATGDAPVSANGPSRVNWRRALVAVSTLATLGSMAYWTFGWPIFNGSAPQAAKSPDPAPSWGGTGDWRRLDHTMRRSHG